MRAVAYLRTSSATNTGEDKDSAKRQRDAIEEYASRQRIEIVAEYYDAAISGADPVLDRPGFAEMFERIETSLLDFSEHDPSWGAPELPITAILIENASRFARDLAVQIAGHDMLVKHGITLIPVDAPEHFKEDTPTAVMVRQILGAVSQFEKDNLVSKLKKARDRKRAETGKCGGRKSYREMYPMVVDEAKRLRAYGLTYSVIAETLWERGFQGPKGPGSTWSKQAIAAMMHQ